MIGEVVPVAQDVLHPRRPPEVAHPDHKGFFQQPAQPEVLQQRGEGPVGARHQIVPQQREVAAAAATRIEEQRPGTVRYWLVPGPLSAVAALAGGGLPWSGSEAGVGSAWPALFRSSRALAC